jgi:hypothetical protein
MRTFFKYLGYIWIICAAIVIALGSIGIFMEKGFSGIPDLYNPFNVINYIAVIITFLPGLAMIQFSEN